MDRIAIIAPGAMGSAVGRRLKSGGATVLTSLAGRSAASRGRAEAAGLADADDDAIAQADILLSIVPPADAMAVAERFAEALARAPRKAIYVDCNAVNVATVERIAAVIAPSGAPFVDGGIIGAPADPTFYFCGESAQGLAELGRFGLTVRVMDAPVGAASALKMSYGGINKGITLLTAVMVLGASRAGAAEALKAELAQSQPQLIPRLAKTLPDMIPKASRWGPEMQEVAEFLGDDAAGRAVFEGLAGVCREIAADLAGDRTAVELLEAFAASLRQPRG